MKRRLTWEQVVPFPGNPIYPGRLKQMRNEWGGYYHGIVGSPAIFDNSSAAFPDYPADTLFVGDGCHRRKLAEEDGKLSEEFLADLYRGLSRKEMYKQRRGLNDRRGVGPAEVFLSRAEENPHGQEQRIKDILAGIGWSVTYKRQKRGLACTNELTWIYRKGGQAVLTQAIQTYEAAFGEQPSWRGYSLVIKGLGAFWMTYPDADMNRLVASLKKITIEQLVSSGRETKDNVTYIKTVFDGVRYSLAASYNRHARHGKRLAI